MIPLHPRSLLVAVILLGTLAGAQTGDEAVPVQVRHPHLSPPSDLFLVPTRTFRRPVRSMVITEPVTTPRSRRQNAHVQWLIGSIRRECTDHIIPVGEGHLLRTLRENVECDNQGRPDQALNDQVPELRMKEGLGQLLAKHVLDGPDHRFSSAALGGPGTSAPGKRFHWSDSRRSSCECSGASVTGPALRTGSLDREGRRELRERLSR